MKKIYSIPKKEIILPKKETVQFLLNYSKSISMLKLNSMSGILVVSNKN
ncbi:hypothetical protein C8P70_11062 [Myroides indicus]|uniref:Uncharacterized protein n=1 Tax=Myroides indicus TaxID=1323422 RepID=A0A4R7EWR2_9FLAO|nr:hypothetical protein C8P70_11062 [Myroides indicus]